MSMMLFLMLFLDNQPQKNHSDRGSPHELNFLNRHFDFCKKNQPIFLATHKLVDY